MNALSRIKQKVDRWTRRHPMTTALLFAALALTLIVIVNQGAK